MFWTSQLWRARLPLRQAAGKRSRARCRRAYCPCIEALEPRCVPSFTTMSYPSALPSSGIAAADFNHDGKVDIALLHLFSDASNISDHGSVGILLGNGD